MNADPNPAKALFLEAVERHAPDQWPAFLDRACAGRPELRSRVEALLEAHREVGTAHRQELPEGADPGPVATVEDPGDVDMVHHRQGLPLGLEAGDHLAAVHARLDDLERGLALHGLGLLGHEDRAHAALADLL